MSRKYLAISALLLVGQSDALRSRGHCSIIRVATTKIPVNNKQDEHNDTSMRKEMSLIEKADFFKAAFEKNLALEQAKQRVELEKLKEKYPAVKAGPAFVATWLAVYFTSLATIYVIIESGVMNAEQFGVHVDTVAMRENTFSWAEQNLIWVPFVRSIVAFFRENPNAANFATAYILTDLMPTSFLAAVLFPFVSKSVRGIDGSTVGTKDTDRANDVLDNDGDDDSDSGSDVDVDGGDQDR